MSNLPTLSNLVDKYGTDKTLSSYTHHYEYHFSPIVDEVLSVLEIGIGTVDPQYPSSFQGQPRISPHYTPGGSLRVWRDFFPNAQVYGIDIAHDCMLIGEERITTFLVDSQDVVACNAHLLHRTFDIIIDDGLHTATGQMNTIRHMFHRVRRSGYYIIEDIGGDIGPDPSSLFGEHRYELLTMINKHMWWNHGNCLIIQKTFDRRGECDTSIPPAGILSVGG